MPPDLNTLPLSRPPSMPGSPLPQRPRRISITPVDSSRPSPPSPRSPSLSSLQAAATVNAGMQRTPSRPQASPTVERRRSSLMNNITLNGPAAPGPGELQQSYARRSFSLNTADHHHRAPSLGELHQELENEGEAQVNRLLQLIRAQQDQLAAMQAQQNDSAVANYPTPPASAVATSPNTAPVEVMPSPRSSHTSAQQAAAPPHLSRPHSLSRRSSALISNPGSRGNSPAMPPQSGSLGPLTEDFLLGGTRDECAFYQAETQTLTRENQMLRLRIRELERQVSDMGNAGASPQQTPNQAHQHSTLISLPTSSTTDAASSVSADSAAKVE